MEKGYEYLILDNVKSIQVFFMIKMAIINKDQVEMSIDFSNGSQNIDF